MILAGDVGGTKTHLALIKPHKTEFLIIKEAVYKSQDYPNLETLVNQFLHKARLNKPIDSVCLGLAGVVFKERCEFLNLNWIVTAKSLRKLLNCEVILLNDLEAMALAIPILSNNELLSLNPQGIKRTGNCALIAAGTGLGQAQLYWNGKDFYASASEGGHVEFAPRNELEIELLRYFFKRFEHVSYERVLSGDGLIDIYTFLKEYTGQKEPDWLVERFKHQAMPNVITQVALAKEDSLCIQSLDIFVSVYGAEAGNLALKSLALGGIYISGGIALKILDKLQDGTFLKSFQDKGRYSSLVAKMPVYIVLNKKLGLLGAFQKVKNLIF